MSKKEWTSVKDGLPNCELCEKTGRYFSDQVLTYGSGVGYGIGRVIDGSFYSSIITHWMPLPEPPHDKDDN